jgi:death-on-curing protein
VKRTRWRWIKERVAFAIQDAQIAEHGGLAGVRDRSVIQSALARPQNLEAYGKPDAADLAAAYAYGLAQNHGFLDGNKRVAYVVARTFLLDNGYNIIASRADKVAVMLSVADGSLPEPQLAEWIRERLEPYRQSMSKK